MSRQFRHYFNRIFYLVRHKIQNCWQMSSSHNASIPRSIAIARSSHYFFIIVQLMQLECQWSFAGAISISVMTFTNNVYLIVMPTDSHDFLITNSPRTGNFTRLASFDNSRPIVLTKYTAN